MAPIAKAVRIVAPLAVVAASARRARCRRVGRVEERVFRLVNDAPDRFRLPVWVVMQSGSLAAVFAVAAVVRRRDRTLALRTLMAGLTAWGAVKPIKSVVGRGRPSDHLDGVNVRGAPQRGLGFPSGHAAVVTTLALMATQPATPTRAAAVATAAATSAARLYVGAHLPLDVIAGLALGAAVNQASRARTDR